MSLTRPWLRYCPISSIAGATTGWLKSLVLQIIPTILSNVNSGAPGHVFAFGSFAPLARPLVRFFCIKASLARKWCAAVMAFSLTRAMMCGKRDEMRAKAGVGRVARSRM